ncbi:hypothetical protein [Falsiphaeobacter marinintestinus]|uniref:hypothetical protein n=1 Tax=Falsiphaeobacter marinintestinus TaxID=1492905 RepID=UPI0011B55E51|nr:hypothetical protein [Phaeobacter marinintestinus]
MKDASQDDVQGAGAYQPGLELKDLLTLAMQLNLRIDTLWHRVVYAHAIMVGVLVFFADPNNDYPFTIPRLLVMFFYSMNTVITFVAFNEAFQGLRAAVEDVRAMGGSEGQVRRWLETRNFSWHLKRRAAILIVLWCVISYLVLYPLFGDLDLIYGDYSPKMPDTTLSNF